MSEHSSSQLRPAPEGSIDGYLGDGYDEVEHEGEDGSDSFEMVTLEMGMTKLSLKVRMALVRRTMNTTYAAFSKSVS